MFHGRILKYSLLVYLLSFSLSAGAFQNTCGAVEDAGSRTVHTICDEQGEVLRIEKIFKKTGAISTRDTFEGDQVVLRQSYNIREELVREFGFEYPDDKTFFKISYVTGLVPRVETSRVLYRGTFKTTKPELIADWVYEKNDEGEYRLKVIDHYDGDLIVKREVFELGKEKEIYVYKHPKVPSIFKHVDSFVAYNSKGEVVKEYQTNQSIDATEYVTDIAKLDVLTDPSRRRMIVLDTGFDVSHPDLAYKFHLNPKDKLDGVDNDGNGIVDDVLGWNVLDDGSFSNNINEHVAVKPKSKPYKPFSHGTHVASIALRDVDEFSLTAYSGNMSDVKHLKMISEEISESQIEYINMSFSLGDFKDPMAPARASFTQLEKMITSNPESVFVVAAGNDEGKNLDKAGVGMRSYPASYRHENILTVGALDSAEIEEFRMPFYRPVFFSTFGIKLVDIYAPGHQVNGAAVGGGQIAASGTSMAAPSALNLILKIAVAFPSLRPSKVREIVLYSAYIPNIDLPFDCSSGGMIFPRRAFEVARRAAETSDTVKQVALSVRAEEAFLLSGEVASREQILKLENLWLARGL